MAPQCQRTCLALFLIFGSSLACSRSASYYIAKGKQLRAKGKFEEAVLNFQKAIKKDPRNRRRLPGTGRRFPFSERMPRSL